MLYQTLLLLIGIIVGFVTATVIVLGFKYKDVRDEDGEKPGFLRRGIVGRQQDKKKRNIEKLKNYIEQKDVITNDEIEKLLGVSDSTATRYLKHLEKEDILEQVGEIGKHVRYRVK